jgi:formate dehydrogenase iron-sulfur subunit
LWKGKTKPLALLVMGLTALAGFFHFVRVGPNEVDERDEAAARQTLEGGQTRRPSPDAGAAEKRP